MTVEELEELFGGREDIYILVGVEYKRYGATISRVQYSDRKVISAEIDYESRAIYLKVE